MRYWRTTRTKTAPEQNEKTLTIAFFLLLFFFSFSGVAKGGASVPRGRVVLGFLGLGMTWDMLGQVRDDPGVSCGIPSIEAEKIWASAKRKALGWRTYFFNVRSF